MARTLINTIKGEEVLGKLLENPGEGRSECDNIWYVPPRCITIYIPPWVWDMGACCIHFENPRAITHSILYRNIMGAYHHNRIGNMVIPTLNGHNMIFGAENNWYIDWETVEHSDIICGHEVNIDFFKVQISVRRGTTVVDILVTGGQPIVGVLFISVL